MALYGGREIGCIRPYGSLADAESVAAESVAAAAPASATTASAAADHRRRRSS